MSLCSFLNIPHHPHSPTLLFSLLRNSNETHNKSFEENSKRIKSFFLKTQNFLNTEWNLKYGPWVWLNRKSNYGFILHSVYVILYISSVSYINQNSWNIGNYKSMICKWSLPLHIYCNLKMDIKKLLINS